MSTSQNDGTPSSTPPSGGGSLGENSGPLVSQRAATVGTAAAVIGGVIGALTYIEAGNLAGAVIAGLMTFGASVLGLHKVIGS
ncbi:hypothetical protein ACFWG7_24060 [Streptomyces koyangensis]|uniref:hypothetical protein n=1 Tax=Streptomyces TaxID=1883 RepID=UPI00081D52AC|nr:MULTISPECIES: hypothetical protein [unclassified Streptomyces]MCK2145367.1 hypothetical protein [Streptomyces sp. WAC00276]WTD94905.1 hypothetical protein OG950_00155 [Streptomyces albidoflavus]SCE46531.1 hypothetical protein GA0115236_161524 [Streptomyces sp. IgraMP-1]